MNRIDFKGDYNKKNYFEGWYFKFVDTDNDLVIILIPGISVFNEKFAFLQYIIHYQDKTYLDFIKYDLKNFHITRPFKITFSDGIISENNVCINFKNIKINLYLNKLFPLKNTLLNPSIMGFFEYFNMPCYHDVISLQHDVTGEVSINENNLVFNGNGYIEKDRGCSFPKFYLWAQCNNFNKRNSSLFLSVADIDSKWFKFLGHIAVFYDGIKVYRFASYLGSKVKVMVNSDKTQADIIFINKKHTLEVKLLLNQGNKLIAPMFNKMDFKIKEQVKTKISINFNGYTDESEFCASELVNWR